MHVSDLSALVIGLTASALDASPAEHQGRMVGLIGEITRFDAAWWGWSNFSGGRITLVNSGAHNLPRSFDSAVRAVSHVDPFIRHGRSLPVFSMALVPEHDDVAPEFSRFAQAFGLRAILNGHCRLGGSSGYNFFMSLYRYDESIFTAEEVADFRIILRHLEQSLSLSLRAEIRARAPQGGEAALIDSSGQLVRASRGFVALLQAEGLTPRRLSAILRRLGTEEGRWVGTSTALTSEPYVADLMLVRLVRSSVWNHLAQQERRVAELYLSGLTTREIATSFRVSPNTVRNQIAAIYRKTGTDGKLALARVLAPKR